ncbi:pyridoxal-phosphate dependent enzyme [Nocardia sp. 2]|uniref:Pyridoxal-phosphate dependent enzyme n=1 Tax=Nocardia acididurans TaxID=2802282 RepID=A0ABS1MCI6_9NOCA|nr:pyridoxal-phosphate dependent enzyme [Nocardia acididurans]MBL1078373.1 pyridoxal-phosphate dependent enzyme [Nocardia acididurans]
MDERLDVITSGAAALSGSGSLLRFESLATGVGNTPVVELETADRLGARLFVKLEGNNPTGSVKDRACVAMLRKMVDDPSWCESKVILDASSGSMGCSIAYFGRTLGSQVRIVSSSKLTPEKRFFIEYFGAELDTIGTFTIEGNNFCRAEAQANPEKYYFLDQLHNSVNPQIHHDTTGPEILAQVPNVSAVIGSIGSGGTLLGVGRYIKGIREDVAVIAVEAESGTRIPGTAALIDGDYRTPFIAEGYEHKIFDTTIRVAERDAVAIAQALPAAGLFVGLQTSAVVSAAYRAIEQFSLKGDVVLLSGDNGWKNIAALASKVRHEVI